MFELPPVGFFTQKQKVKPQPGLKMGREAAVAAGVRSKSDNSLSKVKGAVNVILIPLLKFFIDMTKYNGTDILKWCYLRLQ